MKIKFSIKARPTLGIAEPTQPEPFSFSFDFERLSGGSPNLTKPNIY